MDWAYNLSGNGTPLVRKHKVGVSVPTIGIPIIQPGAGLNGVSVGTTTGAANMVGANLDTAVYATAQVAGGSPEAFCSVIINPDAVYRMLMSGGATEGTALTLFDITAASTDGLTITTGDNWGSPEFDEGTVWGYDGANAGQSRQISTSAATYCTVLVAFNNDTVVGDNFLRAPYAPLRSTTLQFTTNLTQADASIAVGTGAAMRCVELDLRDIGGRGTTHSLVYATSNDHIFNTAT